MFYCLSSDQFFSLNFTVYHLGAHNIIAATVGEIDNLLFSTWLQLLFQV